MLHWHSISVWGIECVAFSFAYEGCQYIHYVLLLPNQFLITWLRRPEIIDARLTLIFRRMLWCCSYHFCGQRQPIISLCCRVTKSPIKYPTDKSNNRWQSLDPHCTLEVSAICNHLNWHRIWLMVFQQAFNRLLVPSSLWRNYSSIIHINVLFKTYFKVSANCW